MAALNIEKMKKMLLNPKYTMSMIAREMGYDSVQVLSSDFKKMTGMTPFKYVREEEFKAENPIVKSK
ncbi:MAG: helix-turn-helix domain-containing protein [Chitinophagales bacterium]|nr:helix-turn-helix domain-containing protein [Chitinophagales bacterium]